MKRSAHDENEDHGHSEPRQGVTENDNSTGARSSASSEENGETHASTTTRSALPSQYARYTGRDEDTDDEDDDSVGGLLADFDLNDDPLVALALAGGGTNQVLTDKYVDRGFFNDFGDDFDDDDFM